MAIIHQINVSGGGVPKLPIDQAHVSTDGVEGDDQANKKHHGGPGQTLCLYSLEVIEGLQQEGHPIAPGNTGENLTISGLDWAKVSPGQKYRAGNDLVFEITFPASPCSKNAQWFLERDFMRMSHDKFPGSSRWYARVVAPGDIRTGDQVVPVD